MPMPSFSRTRLTPSPAKGAALTLLLALAGCGGGTMHKLGLVHDAPDEFKVTTRAPLEIPSNLDAPLQPPRPGAPRPQEQSESIGAEAALAPSAALADPSNTASSGQKALLSAAGPASRSGQDKKKSGVVDSLMFWKGSDENAPTTVNAAEEAARLRQKGVAVPSAPAAPEPKKKSSFLGIF